MTIGPNGQHIASGLPAQHQGFKQNIEGGLLEGAAKRTAASIKTQASHAVKSGATMRGGAQTEYHPPKGAEGGTIKGVSASANTGKLLQHLNGLKTAAVYDHLGNTTPYKVGGKRRRKTNGRSNKRNDRRRRRKSSHRTRRRSKP